MRAPRSSREDVRTLQLGFIHERMGFIRASTQIAQNYCEIGDVRGLEYQIKVMLAQMRAATATFKEIGSPTPESAAS